jgi:DNA repair protein REV1
MGHGICDNLSRSVTLASFTDSSAEMAAQCWQLYTALRVHYADVRGMGITVSQQQRFGGAAPLGPVLEKRLQDCTASMKRAPLLFESSAPQHRPPMRVRR